MALRLKSELASVWTRRRLRKYVETRLRENRATVRAVEVKLRLLTAVLASAVFCEVLVIVYLSLPLYNGEGGGVNPSRAKREITVGPPLPPEPSVEFINPKLRSEFEEKEKHNNSRDSGSNPWVWLTSYSRVPVNGGKFYPTVY